MEEVIGTHPDIADYTIFGKADESKRPLPLGFCVTNDGASHPTDELERELIASAPQKIGAVAAVKKQLYLYNCCQRRFRAGLLAA